MQSGKKEGHTYIVWAHEGRLDKGARRVIHVSKRIIKTGAVETKGKERSREVEIDGRNLQIRNSKASTARRKRYI